MSELDLSGSVSDTSVSQPAPAAAAPAPASSQIDKNDYVPKSRVQEIVHERTREAIQKTAEKTRAEVLAEIERKQQTQAPSGVGMGGMQHSEPMTEERFRQLAADVFKSQSETLVQQQRQAEQQHQMQQIANDYMSKLSAAKDKYPDLIKRQDEITELAMLVPLINESPEAAGITQHLLDNEMAFANLAFLQAQSPAKARSALRKIEAQLKANNDALDRSYPREPLSDVKPSVNTGDSSDTGSSIEALKRQPWLRG